MIILFDFVMTGMLLARSVLDMKIAILTFWWAFDNYGQLLQCYVLQKYLRGAGHDAFVIRYDNRNDLGKTPFLRRCVKALNPFKLAKFLLYKKRVGDVKAEQIKNDRHFDDFRKKYIAWSPLEYKSWKSLSENPPEADVYIVGSDQVWNFSFYKNLRQCRNLIHAYFLDFGKSETKRMSYAASWSCDNLPESFISEIRPLLAKFRYVSTREKAGIEMCAKCGRSDAVLVPDPTLLLSTENYRNLYAENEIRKPEKSFLLLYMLSNECNFDIQNVYDFARQKNLEVMYVTGNSVLDRREKFFATIPEWLYLVDNAEYVVTNSFHCSLFTLLFKKRLGVVPLAGAISPMNTRMETLFEMFGIEERWLTDDFSVLEKNEKAELRIEAKFDVAEAIK